MANICVTLQNNKDHTLYITIEVNVTASTETKMESRVDDKPEPALYAGRLAMPRSAVEAACFSGAFFALRQIGAMHQVGFGYVVTIGNVSGTIAEDLTPCATAAFVGVAYLTHHQEIVTKDRLNEWRLIEYSTDLEPVQVRTATEVSVCQDSAI